MRRHQAAAVAGAFVLVLSACSDGSPASESTGPVAPLVTTATEAPAPSAAEVSLCTLLDGPSCVFERGRFSNPTVIDNVYLPLTPGTQLVYEGTTNEGELLDHQVIITVTDLTKVIDGVETVVSWDLDFSDGELVEAELAFFAQDDDGNVWRMGEHPEEYEDGVLVDAPTWLAGIDGAKAGIAMLGDPVVGTLSYSQGWGPAVEFIDRAQVAEVRAETCVEADCYNDVLVVDEFNTEEANARQLKLFAPGVGNVQVDWAGADETREELELVAIHQLDEAAMFDVRAAALELEASAYEISPDVYGLTQPAVATGPGAPGDVSPCSAFGGLSCVFERGRFSNPTVIDNVYLPLTPGTQLVYEGTTNEGELLDHQVIITVTDLTKVIDGVETVVSWDLDFSDGELVEAELAFFAQDDDGNVWRMGEHPEEYEDGVLVDAPTWLAGIDGAKAGIAMLGDPVVGTLSYSQGWGPAVEFIDRAQVAEVRAETCVEADCYNDVLVINEFNLHEPGAFQLKLFAPGVGNVQVDWAGADETREELELVAIHQLDEAAMFDVRAAALELEASAYEISPDVYGLTQPLITAEES